MNRFFRGFSINQFVIGSLTQPFEPFRFWLRGRADILNRKSTPGLVESERGLLNV
jgi:hypothetical protein